MFFYQELSRQYLQCTNFLDSPRIIDKEIAQYFNEPSRNKEVLSQKGKLTQFEL
jgi:hypothetical protein